MWTQKLIQSEPHQAPNTRQRERQTDTIKQSQNEWMASKVGSSFPKNWQLCYPNLIEYILNLRNCKKENKNFRK